MAKVGAQRAAELTGKSKSTIQRAMNSGKLSYEKDKNDRRVVDVSELDRVFGLTQNGSEGKAVPGEVERELEKAKQMLETERLQMRIKMLEDQLFTANQQIDDLKEQRDRWQKQADQVLLTSQATQKQADEYRQELKQREEQARAVREERKKKALEERMARLRGDNENAGNARSQSGSDASNDGQGLNFQSLWKKVKGQ